MFILNRIYTGILVVTLSKTTVTISLYIAAHSIKHLCGTLGLIHCVRYNRLRSNPNTQKKALMKKERGCRIELNILPKKSSISKLISLGICAGRQINCGENELKIAPDITSWLVTPVLTSVTICRHLLFAGYVKCAIQWHCPRLQFVHACPEPPKSESI